MVFHHRAEKIGKRIGTYFELPATDFRVTACKQMFGVLIYISNSIGTND